MRGKCLRGICLMLTLLFISGFSLTVHAANYSDISSHWAEAAIYYWTDKDVLTGYPDNTFLPNNPITRAEAAKILVCALDLDCSSSQPQYFSDVSAEHWAYAYINACAGYGLFEGYGDGTFHPNSYITRQETMTVLYRVTDYQADSPESYVANCPDGNSVASWALTAVGVLMEHNVILGYEDGSICPEKEITRAEFVSLMYRIDANNGHWKEDLGGPIFLTGLTWTSDTGVVSLSPQTINNTEYLFLPSSADITNLALDIQISAPENTSITKVGDLGEASGDIIDLTSISSQNSDGSYTLKIVASCSTLSKTLTVQVMCSENISSIFLTSSNPDSEGRDYVEAVKGNSTTGSMVMLDTDGSVIYNNTLSQIKSRGNSTFFYEKKPYQIKLNKKTDLLGNGEKVKTWVLLAGYADATLFHDKLCKDLASDMNMEGAPDCQWVDLYYDGEYRGVYLLSEKVAIDSTGVNITDLEGAYEDVNDNYGDDVVTETAQNRYGNNFSYVTGLTDPDDISDGYLLELNYRKGDENCWFKTSYGYAFNIKAPENVSLAAATYISEFYQEFEDAVYATDESGNYTGINPATGKAYNEYCDLTSLVQMYLIYLFSNNQDAYVQSTFFYLSEGSLYAGPIWDSDQIFGTSWSVETAPDSELKWSYLVEALVRIPSFQQAVKDYYQSTFRDLALNYATNQVYAYENHLSAAEQMNHVIWPNYYRYSGLGLTYAPGTTYANIIEEKSLWMRSRIDFMDDKINIWP